MPLNPNEAKIINALRNHDIKVEILDGSPELKQSIKCRFSAAVTDASQNDTMYNLLLNLREVPDVIIGNCNIPHSISLIDNSKEAKEDGKTIAERQWSYVLEFESANHLFNSSISGVAKGIFSGGGRRPER